MFKRLLLFTMAFFSLALAVAPLQTMAFDPFGRVDCSSGSGSAVCTDKSNTENPITGDDGIVLNVIDILALISGAIAVIIIIVSGFRFVTSGGSSDEVAGARRSITYAIIGLVVIALARTIIAFVLARI